MTQATPYRQKHTAFVALTLVFFLTAVVYAADPPFAGKWKGETRVVAAPAGGPAAAAPAAGAGAPAAGRGGGGGRGGFGGGGGGSTKVTLNLKISKDNKVSGNITLGETDTNDVKEGKIDGNILTFKAGRFSQLQDYKAELKENEIILTRVSTDARGGRPQEWVLTKK